MARLGAFTRRADHDGWGRVFLICVATYAAYIAIGVASTAFYFGRSRVALAMFCIAFAVMLFAAGFGMRRVTRSGRWWLGLLLLTPLAFVLAVNASVFVGLGPTQFEIDGIGESPQTYTSADRNLGVTLYVETHDQGSTYDRQHKDVWIRVTDPQGKLLLNDHAGRFFCCQVTGTTVWQGQDRFTALLAEEGSENTGTVAAKYGNDPYSVALARSGPKKLGSFTYQYDSASKTFVRLK